MIPTYTWMSVVLCSWGTPLVNIAEGNPTWQSSQWSDAAARLAVDGNDNPDLFAGSCSHTTDSDITEPPVWAVDLGHDLIDVYHVEVANRDYLEGKDLSNEWQVYTCFPIYHLRLALFSSLSSVVIKDMEGHRDVYVHHKGSDNCFQNAYKMRWDEMRGGEVRGEVSWDDMG